LLSKEIILALSPSTDDPLRLATIRAHLGSTCHVIVFTDVEVADGAGGSPFEEPFVDALSVEEVEAGHCPKFLTSLVLDLAHHALRLSFAVVGIAQLSTCLGTIADLFLGYKAHRKTLNN